jgi:PIN domain nuclease of toxin-antitoxin system
MIVLDSSVILAMLFEEPGGELAEEALADAAMSTVNIAEVYTRARSAGIGTAAADAIFAHSKVDIGPLSLRQAQLAGELQAATIGAGLSLGDRCCLALAWDRKLPVLTADRAWAQFDGAFGFEIRLIR